MDDNENKVEEPIGVYQKSQSGRLTFFSSFDEEKEAQYNYWRSLTPEERMEEHRKISLVVFSGYERYAGNRLMFD